jgi:hypothetical protein
MTHAAQHILRESSALRVSLRLPSSLLDKLVRAQACLRGYIRYRTDKYGSLTVLDFHTNCTILHASSARGGRRFLSDDGSKR